MNPFHSDPIWYPFTQMKEFESCSPLIIERGEGNYLYDGQGKKYLDAISSLWANVHGHNHPILNKAIEEQLKKVAHTTLLGLSNDTAIKLAKKLIDITPKELTKVFYSDDGSTAVEVALKMAYQYHQQHKDFKMRNKTKFITLKEAYHGDTIGAVGVGGIELFHKTYQRFLFETIQVESSHCYRCPFSKTIDQCNFYCYQKLEEIFQQHHEECCAFVIEPLVQGAAGMIMPPKGYLRKVRELCSQYDVLMIADEVAVGFGKTGTLFACEQENISPDIMVLAKGITGGYLPLAATIVAKKIYDGFLAEYEEMKTFFHGHTYTGNALAAAVACANIDLLIQNCVVEKLSSKIDLLTQELFPIKNLQHVGDIRQQGLMVGIELIENRETKKRYPLSSRIGHKVILKAREKGFIIRPIGDVIILMPPLSIETFEIKNLCFAIYQSIKEVTEGLK